MFFPADVMFFIFVHCRSLNRGKSISSSLLSFELFPLIPRQHQTNKGQKHFSKQRKSLQQPAAPLLSLQRASQSHPHRPQMQPQLPQKHPPSSPDEGVGAQDLGPSLTTGSSFPGSTPFPRKWQNYMPKKGQQIHHCIKTAVVMTCVGMETALRAAAWTETCRAGGCGQSQWWICSLLMLRRRTTVFLL